MTDKDFGKVVCPACNGLLNRAEGTIVCESCEVEFNKNSEGFYDMTIGQVPADDNTTTDTHAGRQSSEGANRLDDEFIIPYLHEEPFESVLDVGCGIGRTIGKLIRQGHDAYGVDLQLLSPFWAEAGLDPGRFFCAEATRLPFPDDSFDAVISLGVIEHIGTLTGNCTLSSDFMEARRRYAAEILRVTRRGGRILISCPNKKFPIDPQHQVIDRLSPDKLSTRLRDAIFNKTNLNIHRTWGEYYLPSYSEVEELFCGHGGASDFEPLSLKGYFELEIFKHGFMRRFSRLADIYINRMPRIIRSSFMNPYILVQIRK